MAGESNRGAGASRARVLIADDDAFVRGWVRRILVEDGRFAVCAEASDASSCVAEAARHQPDLCLLDVRMPAGGVAAAREISARLPQTKVVMLTVSDDDNELFAALSAGVSGYILKRTEPFELGDALQNVLDGAAAISPELMMRIISEFRDYGPRRRTVSAWGINRTLTMREWEVLELLRRKLSTAQIASRLFVSPATVRSHVASILKKLEVPDRAAAIRLFDEGSASIKARI